MDGGSADGAMERIEAAIARIELASSRASEAGAAAQARHERLRVAVGEALRQLDALIADAAAPAGIGDR